MLTSCETKPSAYTLKLITNPTNGSEEAIEYPYTIQWDDSAFLISPVVFSEQIAKTAMILSASAYDNDIVMQNLTALGFAQKAKFNYQSDYNEQQVALALATRNINGTNIVIVVVRGTYKQEWYSNFDIGKNIDDTGVHNGFFEASQFVLEKIKMYMTNYSIDIENTKFLLTGHSRGGAVANLTAASLIDTYSSDKVYAYTFAAPNTTTNPDSDNQRYSGIFNFVNPEDFIAHIPLEKWGFTKYGTTITFPAKDTDEQYEEKLKTASEYYQKYTKSTLKTFEGTQKLNEFLDTAYTLAKTVDDYYNKKYEIAGLSMSLYDFMMTVAYVMNNENVITNGLILISSDSSDFEPITSFLLSGMNADNMMSQLDYNNALIAHAHMPQTYIAWLDTYIDNL